MSILDDRRARPWIVPVGGRASFVAEGSYLGNGRTPLEIAVARSGNAVLDADVRNLWKRRKGNTPSPLLLVVLWNIPNGERASVCGPSGDEPAVYGNRDPQQINRIAGLALDETDQHAARRLLDDYLPREGGVRNRLLFASRNCSGAALEGSGLGTSA